jgi:D-arabinose 1-dehydrogenase-like Zn-dependent alcohol dehydrogenase
LTDAAPLSCAIGTGIRAVMTRGDVTSGDRVVVIGLGGVGIHAAQIAAAVGVRVIGLDVHAPTLEMARSLGLDAQAADGDATTLRDALDGEGADVAIDAVGTAETIARAAEIARPGGRIVAVGHSAGAVGPPLQRIVLEELERVGSRSASLDEMARGVAMVADGSVRPVIGMLRRLEQANEVLDALEAGRVVGRAVLEVA